MTRVHAGDGRLLAEYAIERVENSLEQVDDSNGEIGDIVLKLNQEEGLTILLVEQKLPFARRVASEFCILDKGRRVAAGSIGELTDQVVRAHLSV